MYTMKTYFNPSKNEWKQLIARPAVEKENLFKLVDEVFTDIQENGDTAVRTYCRQFDQVELDALQVSEQQIKRAVEVLYPALKEAILLAKSTIEKFHAAQRETPQIIETAKGVSCWRESRAIEKVGIYIPGGSAPLFSTVLMLGIPAKLAGCTEIVLCTPSNQQGEINPAILYTAQLVGINTIFAIGGIQAIGAMTFGTASVPKVDKIFGPGNQYVTAAKQSATQYGVAIDMPAGPSEVLIIADANSNPAFVAADLLSQAEHGADSQVMLLSDNSTIIEQTLAEIQQQVLALPRKETVEAALKSSKAILLDSIETCIDFSNAYAPEHLILAVQNFADYTQNIRNAGSVFLGNYSCESAGDYASGTNHTLPTNGFARNYSGVSLDSFIKKITFQELTPEGLQTIGPAIERMAEAEQLLGHKNAVSVRLSTLKSEEL